MYDQEDNPQERSGRLDRTGQPSGRWIIRCMYCGKVRNNGDKEAWNEEDCATETALVSHSICPECFVAVLPRVMDEIQEEMRISSIA